MSTVESYADLGRQLWQQAACNRWGGWHGQECPCLACADERATRAVVIDDRRRGRTHSDISYWRQGATRLGIEIEEYLSHIEAGERWCSGHRRWESRYAFGRVARNRQRRNPYCAEWVAHTARLRRAAS